MSVSPTSTKRQSTVPTITPTSIRRTPAVPNNDGDKALYTISTQTIVNPLATETRIISLQNGTSTVFSNQNCDREVTWLGEGNKVVWLKDAASGATEIWIADASGQAQESHCAGRIASRAFHLRVKRLRNEYDDIAIAVACSATSNGNLFNPETGMATGSEDEARNAIWFTTLRKKTVDNDISELKYFISPTKWTNALRGSDLSSPLTPPTGALNDFDISLSGIVFLSKDTTSGSTNFPSINVYYIPLKTFTEVSRPRPQIIKVKGFEGPSLNPVFSPGGNSVAFLKKKHPIDRNDRNRIIVINHIRDFRAHMSMEDLPHQQSQKEWHLSPFSVAFSDDGKELYAVAVDQGIRKLFKIPAALSSIKKEPEPITSGSKTPADVRHLRMVFSAPMETGRP